MMLHLVQIQAYLAHNWSMDDGTRNGHQYIDEPIAIPSIGVCYSTLTVGNKGMLVDCLLVVHVSQTATMETFEAMVGLLVCGIWALDGHFGLKSTLS
jgi:hypothetical protein